MSEIADSIKINQNQTGMLRRALQRIIQLYTDRSHFIYELLQNAEDAKANLIKFVQYPDRLEVMHDGKPFTKTNLQRLCDIGQSDKVDDLNQIGQFGVGFKSVFGICDTVMLYSEPSHFRNNDIDGAFPFAVQIDDFISPKDIAPIELEDCFTTKFIFPYSCGNPYSGFKEITQLNETLSKKFKNLGATTLLFMKNLKSIEYEIRTDFGVGKGSYQFDQKRLSHRCTLVTVFGSSKASFHERENSISYLKFSRPIDIESNRSVDIAFAVELLEDGKYQCIPVESPYVSVYFPTETESKLHFIVQGPYRTTPNRSSIPADDEDNIELAEKTAELFCDAITELRDRNKLNMSFLKTFPLSEECFENYGLFLPAYEKMIELFSRIPIIPCLNGGYTLPEYAKIPRPKELETLFPDKLLTSFINDGKEYKWLSPSLSDTNREYEGVYKFLTHELKVGVFRPETLRQFFDVNPSFIKSQSDEWIARLYNYFRSVPNLFSKATNEANLLTVKIIKTETGHFVSAYRRVGTEFVMNVFLHCEDTEKFPAIHFVSSSLYERCRYFFDRILRLEQPNEYELFLKDIKDRYEKKYPFDEDLHFLDLLRLYQYSKRQNPDEIQYIIRNNLLLKCTDGEMRNAYKYRLFLPVSQKGIRIKDYFKNLPGTEKIFFIDDGFYSDPRLLYEILPKMGVQTSIVYNADLTEGTYLCGNRGKDPKWTAIGNFKWKLQIRHLDYVLPYISRHPDSEDSFVKSKTIMDLLFLYQDNLKGDVHINGNCNPDLKNVRCGLIETLNRNGKINPWLFDKSKRLVSAGQISKSDLNVGIYGPVKLNTPVYDLLGFRKNDSEEVEALKKGVSDNVLKAYFEEEFHKRFGMSSSSFEIKYKNQIEQNHTDIGEFPTARVRNLSALAKHAAEILYFSDSVQYAYVKRHLRINNNQNESQAYLKAMYQYEDSAKYACQMCHKPFSSIEAVQLLDKEKKQLSPMHLCLCPNCAQLYRDLRRKNDDIAQLKNRMLDIRDSALSEGSAINVSIRNHNLWFTQIHAAEIRELLKLLKNKDH